MDHDSCAVLLAVFLDKRAFLWISTCTAQFVRPTMSEFNEKLCKLIFTENLCSFEENQTLGVLSVYVCVREDRVCECVLHLLHGGGASA